MKNENHNWRSLFVFALVIAAALAVVVAGIEIGRRTGGAPAAPTIIAENAAMQPFPRELKDAAGEILILKEKPQRIVSQTLGTDEILLSICPTEQLVALSSLAEDPKLSNVVEPARRVADRTTAGAEQILQLQPDLIFVASFSRADTVELLKTSKAPVFRFANFDSFEDIKNNIRTVGFATGCDREAEKLVNNMTDQLAAIRARVPLRERRLRIMSYGGGFTAGTKTTFDEMARAVGAINVSAENGIESFVKINSEKLLEWQPDFIVAGGSFDELEAKKKQLLADPVIAATDAGKAGRVIVIDNRHYLAVSQFVVRAVEDLFQALYESDERGK